MLTKVGGGGKWSIIIFTPHNYMPHTHLHFTKIGDLLHLIVPLSTWLSLSPTILSFYLDLLIA